MEFEWYFEVFGDGGGSGGGGGTGAFWSLLEANPEVNGCVVPIVADNESVFPKMLELYGNYNYSRDIVVDLSNYNGEFRNIENIFGDISNIPIGIRYHIYISGYTNSIKIDFPLEYSTNWTLTHVQFGRESFTIPYSGATKIEFIKLSATNVWVDVTNKSY